MKPNRQIQPVTWADLNPDQQRTTQNLISAAGLSQQPSYTVAEFARIVLASPSTILRRIRAHAVSALRHGRVIRVPIAEIARLLRF